ncbi:MAG: class II aldolase/adducin family protein [Proteobacteria bacterium]|nr:class II aldolase/adducin family protein [Pseudomonadota bacterium]
MLETEGVTRFRALHQEGPLDEAGAAQAAPALLAWRRLLHQLALIGQQPQRYGGLGFGNVSVRLGPPRAAPGSRPFLITGTQTGAPERLPVDQLCVVTRYELQHNAVHSRGPVRPSSEALTHGAIYDLSARIGAVLHVHSPVLWQQARALGLPQTPADVAYGTVEMARAVQRLDDATEHAGPRARARVWVMAGHEDGVIAWGRDLDQAGAALLCELARAYALPMGS